MLTVMSYELSDRLPRIPSVIGIQGIPHNLSLGKKKKKTQRNGAVDSSFGKAYLGQQNPWLIQKRLQETAWCFPVKGLKRYHLLITLWNDSSSYLWAFQPHSAPGMDIFLSSFSLTSVVFNCLSCLAEDSPRVLFPGVNETRERKVTPRAPTRLRSPSGWSRLTPAAARYLKHSCVWSARLVASASCTRAGVARLVQLWQPLCKFLLLYLHTEQTGNCVHLYANVFVPKAGILN